MYDSVMYVFLLIFLLFFFVVFYFLVFWFSFIVLLVFFFKFSLLPICFAYFDTPNNILVVVSPKPDVSQAFTNGENLSTLNYWIT